MGVALLARRGESARRTVEPNAALGEEEGEAETERRLPGDPEPDLKLVVRVSVGVGVGVGAVAAVRKLPSSPLLVSPIRHWLLLLLRRDWFSRACSLVVGSRWLGEGVSTVGE